MSIVSVTIIQRGITPEQMAKQIEGKVIKIQQAITELGTETAQNMRGIIFANTKRQPASGRLATSIRNEMLPDGVGIGKIADLPEYWYVVNYGKYYDSNTPFIPGGGEYRPIMFTDGMADPQLRGTGSARATMIKRITSDRESIPLAIRAMNYIEKTNNWLMSYWETYILSRAR